MDNELQEVLNVFNGGDTKQESETTDPANLVETEEVDNAVNTATEEETTEEQSEENRVNYDQEVPLVNGERMTVGQLKDFVQSAKKQQADFIEKENVVLRKLDEVNRLSQYLDVVPPEVKQQAIAEMQETIKQEFTRMLDVIPQWKDAVEFNKGKESIYNLAREYNLERDISQVSDHRVVKLLYDFARIKDSLRATKDLKPKPATQAKAQSKAPQTQSDKQNQLINRAKQTKSHDDELAAIKALF